LRRHPWWLYGPYAARDFLPWTPLALALLAFGWRRDGLARLGLAWCVAVVAVLSCASFKRTDYLLPAWPGAALFLGCTLEGGLGRGRRAAVALGGGVALLALLMVVGWGVWVGRVLPGEEAARDSRPFAEAVRAHAPAPEEVTFFRTEAHSLA